MAGHRNANKTHCKWGHEFNSENTIVKANGKRNCRTCEKTRLKRWHEASMFDGVREAVIKRDGEKCLHCGMTREEHLAKYKMDITVDHIDGMGTFVPQHLKNNKLSNLQTLCVTCHTSKDVKRRWARVRYAKQISTSQQEITE